MGQGSPGLEDQAVGTLMASKIDTTSFPPLIAAAIKRLEVRHGMEMGRRKKAERRITVLENEAKQLVTNLQNIRAFLEEYHGLPR